MTGSGCFRGITGKNLDDRGPRKIQSLFKTDLFPQRSNFKGETYLWLRVTSLTGLSSRRHRNKYLVCAGFIKKMGFGRGHGFCFWASGRFDISGQRAFHNLSPVRNCLPTKLGFRSGRKSGGVGIPCKPTRWALMVGPLPVARLCRP